MTRQAHQHDSAGTEVVISVDAMGGDRGPAAVVGGMARSASRNPEIRFIVHGDAPTLERLIARRRQLAGRCEIRHAEGVVGMEAKPSQVMRNGRDTSMWSALECVAKGNATIAVSCGNTGALMALAMLRLRRLPGVARPAIAVQWPSANPHGFNVLLDAGADVRAEAGDLLQYALMGTSFARNAFSVARPRVGLLNIGTEEHKGRSELREAAELIGNCRERGNFDFVGFVEGSDIPSDRVDVIVTDGFTGNVALKTAEGTASFISRELREAFRHSPLSRIGALFAMTSLKRMRRKIDPRRANGGVFLGLNGTVIKSHGDADATGVSAAIRLAFQLARNGFTEKLAARVASGATQDDNASPAGSRPPKSEE